MAVVLFLNLKGGVAKTTNAVAVAECLASQGKRTLLIDADHQCTASELLLGEERALRRDSSRRTFHDLLAEMLKPEFSPRQFDHYVSLSASNIQGGLETLSVIPCSVRIDDFQTNWAKGGHGFRTWDDYRKLFKSNQRQLEKWLNANFEYVIVDCPPSLAIQVKLILKIVDAYVIPCQPNKLSIRGAIALTDRIQAMGYKKKCIGTLWSMVRGSDALHKKTMSNASSGHISRLPKPLTTFIPLAAKIAHATEAEQAHFASFRGKYGTTFGATYEDLCVEIMHELPDPPPTIGKAIATA